MKRKQSPRRKTFFATFIATLLTLGIIANFSGQKHEHVKTEAVETSGTAWTKITTLAELTEGRYVFMGGSNNKNVMHVDRGGSYQNRFELGTAGTATNLGGNQIDDQKIVWELKNKGTNTFTINSYKDGANGYLYGTADKAISYGSTSKDWVFSVSDGLFTIKETSGPGMLQYNNSAPRFAKYASSQMKISLYKESIQVSSISIQKNPDKMDYYVNDSFDKTGMEVKALYVDGTNAILNNNDISVTPNVMSLGVTSVELNYFGVKTTLSGITVEAIPTVVSLSVSGTPAKTTYFVDESFAYAGLTVTAHLSNGKTEEVQSKATYTPDPLALGDDTITISYGGVTTTYGPITVKVDTSKTIVITKEILGLTTAASQRTHTLENVGFKSYVRDQQGAILFDKGAGYIYNSTSLNNITKIELNYASGGNAVAVQYFNFGDSEIVGHKSSGDVTISTSPKGGSYSFTPDGTYGYFNLSVSSANALQLTSLVVYYSLEQVDLDDIDMNKETVTMNKGDTTTLGIVYTPSNASNKVVTWESSDSAKVSITGTGSEVTLTALEATGATPVTITATSNEGNYVATSYVTVNLVAVTSVSLNKTALTLLEGNSEQLSAEVLPANASNKELTWSSSDTEYVSVSASGLVTGLKPTLAPVTVTATSVDSGEYASASITVNEYVAQVGTYTITSTAKVGTDYDSNPELNKFTVTKTNAEQAQISLGNKTNFRIGASAPGGTPNANDYFTYMMLGGTNAAGSVQFIVPEELYITEVVLHNVNVTDGAMTVNVNSVQSYNVNEHHDELVFNPYTNAITINTTKRMWIGSISITTATVSGAANHFATKFLNDTAAECLAFSVQETTWDNLGDIFMGMDWDVIEMFEGIIADTTLSANVMEQMVARYVYVATKYGYYDFMDLGIVINVAPNITNQSNPLGALLIVGLIGITTLAGYYFISRKEKHVK